MSAIATAIALAVATATNSGVTMDAYVEGDAIWLSAVERLDGRPGSGAEAIRLLMDIAEEHELPIRGAIVHDHAALEAYYAALGFEAVDMRIERGTRRVLIEFMP